MHLGWDLQGMTETDRSTAPSKLHQEYRITKNKMAESLGHEEQI